MPPRHGTASRDHRVGRRRQVHAGPPDRRDRRAPGHPPRPPLLVAGLGPDARRRVGRAPAASCSRATGGSSTGTTAARSSSAPSAPTRSCSSTCPAALPRPGRCAGCAPRSCRRRGARRRSTSSSSAGSGTFPSRSRPRLLAILGTYAADTEIVQLRFRAPRCGRSWPRLRRDRGRDPARDAAIRDDGAVKRIGLVLGAGGLTGQAFHAGVLARARRGDRVGTRATLRSSSGRRPARASARTCASASAVPTSRRCSRPSPLTDAGRRAHRPARPLRRLDDAGRAAELAEAAASPPRRPRDHPTAPRSGPRRCSASRSPPVASRPRAGPASLRARSPVAGVARTTRSGSAPCAWTTRAGSSSAAATRPTTDVATAVAASSAIPGYFQPVEIDGREYVDGGVHSPTNADVLRKEDLDLVLVSSPMSTSRNAPLHHAQPAGAAPLPRSASARRSAASAAGESPSSCSSPARADQAAMGGKAMDPERNAAVVRAARETTLRRLEHGRHADRLAMLAA